MSTPHRFLHADTGGAPSLPTLTPTRMDFFKLQDRFWQLDAEQSFSPAETRLYFYWLNRFNKEYWPGSLPRKVTQVGGDLDLSENTVATARIGLEKRGLLCYKAGNKKIAAQWGLEPAAFRMNLKNSGQFASDSHEVDRKNSGPSRVNPDYSHGIDLKNSGPYKEENKNSSVVKQNEEEGAAPSPSSAAEVDFSSRKNTPQPASQSPVPGTEGGGRRAGVHDDPEQLTDADHCPLLNNPATFRAACLDIDPAYAGIDFEHYRLEILFDSREAKLVLMPYAWRKRLRRWLSNAKNTKSGLLLAALAGQRHSDPRAFKPLATHSSASPTKKNSWD